MRFASQPAFWLLFLLLLGGLGAGFGCRRNPIRTAPSEHARQGSLQRIAAGEVEAALVLARKAWRAEQDQFMRSELSPLARIDYVHLPPGEHRIAALAPPFGLPAAALFPDAGDLRLRRKGNEMLLLADPPVARNGARVTTADLKNGDVLAIGRIRFLIAGMPGDPAVAVYDEDAPARRAYRALRYYPEHPGEVGRAHLSRYAEPRKVAIAASRGEDKELFALGMLHFTLAGNPGSMEAYAEQPGSTQLFLIFKDKTAEERDGSYGAGRYLYAKLEGDGTVYLDFHQAWNPLCAYSAFFHCPLPPRSNWLPFAIPAGEKRYFLDHS